MPLINTQPPESAQNEEPITKDQKKGEDRDHSFKRQTIDSFAHCSLRAWLDACYARSLPSPTRLEGMEKW